MFMSSFTHVKHLPFLQREREVFGNVLTSFPPHLLGNSVWFRLQGVEERHGDVDKR